jgi:hypothetical protein
MFAFFDTFDTITYQSGDEDAAAEEREGAGTVDEAITVTLSVHF